MSLPKGGDRPVFDRFAICLELGFHGKSLLFSASRTFGMADRKLKNPKRGGTQPEEQGQAHRTVYAPKKLMGI